MSFGEKDNDGMEVECMEGKELGDHFHSCVEKGLSKAQREEAEKEHGRNVLESAPEPSFWELLLEQFDDVLVQILLAAAFISFLLAYYEDHSSDGAESAEAAHSSSQYIEPMVILCILALNAIVGVWQEQNAAAALNALKELQPRTARVKRDGQFVTCSAEELVPGDIISIRVGDKIPADARVLSLQSTSLRVDQAQLTGESDSVHKQCSILPRKAPTNGHRVLQEKINMVFSATTVVNGMATCIVTSIGMKTEIGKIQASVTAAAAEEAPTPLKAKLDDFGHVLSRVIGLICIVVWAINYRNFWDPQHGSLMAGCIYYFKIAVALAVAAIPEGLPAVITTCLALGTRKMAAKRAIVRKLPSVETLGCTNVICSDKTGTLTTNEMSAVSVILPGNKSNDLMEHAVEGTTYAPIGDITPPISRVENGNGRKLCQIMSLCNQATLEVTKAGKYTRVGEPTEASLKVLVEKIGSNSSKVTPSQRKANPEGTVLAVNNEFSTKFKTVATLEFARDRKSMSVLVKDTSDDQSPNQLLVKGAPEGILARCTSIQLASGEVVNMSAAIKAKWIEKVNAFGDQALRCLAFAYRSEIPGESILADYDGAQNHPAYARLSQGVDTFAELESNLTLVGIVGMLDPPRAEIAPMISTCNMAGIRVIMITGDNPKTAEAIAVKIGILPHDFDKSWSYTGGEFFQLSESEQTKALQGTHGLVFSRTEPRHKQLLVKLLKSHGDVVAMTGDGVNDAPALKQADIGIAMGITGTEVAKEASDMILADDNFATIVSAVEEGRAIYNNMQAFIRYLISSNIGEVMAIFLTAALGVPEGLIPVQLLWVNLVTDGPPATALGFNPPDAEIMKKLPRKSSDSLITPWTFFRYCVIGLYVGVACVGVFVYWYLYYTASNDGHTLITLDQLSNWGQCHEWTNFKVNDFDGMDMTSDPCKYFTEGKKSASTLSLSVLVTIEMLNALNALSEDGSLLTMPPWSNPYLLLAMLISFGMHFVILYVDILASTFSVTPLDWEEWKLVLLFSFPVILIDEGLKWIGRRLSANELQNRLAASAKKEQ